MFRTLCFVSGCFMLAAFATAQCCFLQRDGCGTGGSFCLAGAVICDISYDTVDTGGGREGPLDHSVKRKCWKILESVTAPCNAAPPPGYQTLGCTYNNICCYGTVVENSELTGSFMLAPSGAVCCEKIH